MKLNKVAVLFATVALASTGTAFAAGSKTNSDNWRSGHGDLQWKSAYGECWADAYLKKGGKMAPACGAPAPKAAPAPKPAPRPVPRPAPKPAPAPAPVVQAPAPAPVVSAQEVLGNTSFGADAFFNFDKATLKPAGKATLDDLASRIQTLVDLTAIVAIGHTDSIGSAAYNQKLSLKRAQSVKNYLTSRGIPASQIRVEGMGERNPIASNKTKSGRAQNRRVDIQVEGTARQGAYSAPAATTTYSTGGVGGGTATTCQAYSIDGTCLKY